MERISKAKLSNEEQKVRKETGRRRHIVDADVGEKAVENINAFLAKEGLDEKAWAEFQKKLNKPRKRMNG